MDTYLNTAEMAKILNIRPDTLRTWVRKRNVPCLRLSLKGMRFERDQVLEWFQDRSRQGDKSCNS